jgi:hypothetical protein
VLPLLTIVVSHFLAIRRDNRITNTHHTAKRALIICGPFARRRHTGTWGPGSAITRVVVGVGVVWAREKVTESCAYQAALISHINVHGPSRRPSTTAAPRSAPVLSICSHLGVAHCSPTLEHALGCSIGRHPDVRVLACRGSRYGMPKAQSRGRHDWLDGQPGGLLKLGRISKLLVESPMLA